MCGIAGVIRFDGRAVDPGVIEKMSGTLVHRGPDDSGRWVRGPVGFGHRRLSIIDLAGSAQPMSSVDGRYHIVFNGEIFNYRELRRELDYPFRTAGDTEVLLALFISGGPAALSRVRGQFAFAVHDAESGVVTLARDRLGVLPLYYRAEGAQLAFGSEVKALWPACHGSARLDETSLGSYLLRRAVPAPDTLYAGVKKLRPGCTLSVGPDGTVDVEAYWVPPTPDEEWSGLGAPEAIDRLEVALRDAVAEAMIADVPVGSYLSGGVDSSLVVALASSLADHPLHTFCATFGDPRFDEGDYASLVSRRFGTDHHEVPVRPGDFMDLWSRLTWHRDAPISEPADIAVFRLAEEARSFVKVVLSGEGSDELFGGYPKYRFAGATSAAGAVPAWLRGGMASPLERALPARGNRLRTALRAMDGATTADRMASWFAPFTPREAARLLGRDQPGLAHEPPSRDAVDLMARMDLVAWLPDNLLERGDRMSMAASLELRPPFLDARLVELAMRLPSSLKVRHGQTKWILKEVAGRHLPKEITGRRKVGFKVPLDAWFRGGLADLSRDLLLSHDSLTSSVLDRRMVTDLLDSHARGRSNEELRIWTLLSLEQWAQTCLEDPQPHGRVTPERRQTRGRATCGSARHTLRTSTPVERSLGHLPVRYLPHRPAEANEEE